MLLKALLNHPVGVAREMDRLFDSMSSPAHPSVPARGHAAFPAVNLWEDSESLIAEAELPGLRLEDVEVFVTDDELTIKGVRAVETPDEARPLRRERPVGAFERTIGLPAPIDGDHVDARLVNGVLSITLPKAAALRPRRIEIKASTPNA